MMIELIIFDWSGTISDDRMPIYLTVNEIRKHFGLPVITYDEFFSDIKSSFREYLKFMGIEVTEKESRSLFNSFYEAVAKNTPPFFIPGVIKILEDIKFRGFKLAVLSAHTTHFVERECGNMQHLFTKIVGSCHDKKEGLLKLCKEVGIPVSSAIYVGDMAGDIRAGKAAGMKTVAVGTGYHKFQKLSAEKPDYMLRNLSELKNLPVLKT